MTRKDAETIEEILMRVLKTMNLLPTDRSEAEVRRVFREAIAKAIEDMN